MDHPTGGGGGGGGGPAGWRRIPRWFLVVVAVLTITVVLLTAEVVQLNRAVRQTRCNSAKATARAVFGGSGKATPDVISRAVTEACSGKHEIFDL